jgi:hypothetical protein
MHRIGGFFQGAADTAREAISSGAKLRALTKLLNGYQRSGGRNEVTNTIAAVRRVIVVPRNRTIQ